MATKIAAIHAYRPKLVLNPTAKLDQVVNFIAMRTGANKGIVWIQCRCARLNSFRQIRYTESAE